MTDIEDLRNNYSKGQLLEEDALGDPFKQFEWWLNEALNTPIIEPTAMILSTVKADGRPAARAVLLKGFDEKGFRFFTNYHSPKGHQLDEHPYAALVFYWGEMERQVRIEGKVDRLPAEESERYFSQRPKASKIGAIASPQSEIIPSRQMLEDKKAELDEKYANSENIPRPKIWGGYRVIPDLFEFWQGRRSRLHDRLEYRLINNNWRIFRLAP